MENSKHSRIAIIFPLTHTKTVSFVGFALLSRRHSRSPRKKWLEDGASLSPRRFRVRASFVRRAGSGTSSFRRGALEIETEADKRISLPAEEEEEEEEEKSSSGLKQKKEDASLFFFFSLTLTSFFFLRVSSFLPPKTGPVRQLVLVLREHVLRCHQGRGLDELEKRRKIVALRSRRRGVRPGARRRLRERSGRQRPAAAAPRGEERGRDRAGRGPRGRREARGRPWEASGWFFS